MAYIQNLEDYENDITTGRMYFPSPSIRYEHKGRNFQVSKKGQNGEPLAGVNLHYMTKIQRVGKPNQSKQVKRPRTE